MKKAKYPTKTSMNLFYKPDRTTKLSTVALYVLFIVVIVVGLAKFMVYDLWMEKETAERNLAAAQSELDDAMLQVSDYDEVHQRYIRYSATDEERSLVDRMDVLAMLDDAVGKAAMDSVSINGARAQIQVSNVTLTQTAEIVSRLQESPMVANIVVNTAATTSDTNGGGEGGDGSGDMIRTDIVIQLQKETADEMEAGN